MKQTSKRRRAKPNVSARAKRREEEILQAAFAVFSEKGYRAASMEDIGARVGMLGGSMYYYFKSKEELLFRIWVNSHAAHMDRIQQIEEAGGTAERKLRTLISMHVASYDPIAARLFFGEFPKMSKSRRAHIARVRRDYENYVVSLIAEGKREALFASNFDEHVAANGLLSMLNSLHLWFDPKGPMTLPQIADQYSRLMIDGLSAPRQGGNSNRPARRRRSADAA